MSELNFPLSDYAKASESHVLKRYHEKISAVGIDPFLVPEKYFNPECLPPVESIAGFGVLLGFGNELLHSKPV